MKLVSLMEGHLKRKVLEEQSGSAPQYAPQDLPIKPRKKSLWDLKKDPNRYRGEFQLRGYDNFANFVQDILELQEETQHHAKILCVYPKVIIEVYTHMLNDVTDVDRDWCKQASAIYKGYAE